MEKHSILHLMTMLMFILTFCAGNAPTPDANAVATAVATLLSTVSTATPSPEPTATFTPEPLTLLPQSLYYWAGDIINGKGQIYRLDRDGTTITQITFELDGVRNFDISSVDGTIVYAIQNNLITVDANGENRRVLVQDPNISFRPVWAPDGKMIAYGSGKDMVIYSFATGNNEMLFSGSDTDWKWPESFSPDGSKLIIRRHSIPSAPGSAVFIYDFASRTLTPMDGMAPQYDSCFNDYVVWSTPNVFFCYGHVFAGVSISGLRRVNAIDGSVEILIGSATCPPCLPVAAPRQDAAGNLYYLYGEAHNVNQPYPSLSLVRSASDGITDRVTVRPETFNVFYALWTPDGSALLIAQNDGTNSFPTNLILVPVNPLLSVVTIMTDASKLGWQSLRWGP